MKCWKGNIKKGYSYKLEQRLPKYEGKKKHEKETERKIERNRN